MQEQKAQGNCPSGVLEVCTRIIIQELDQRPRVKLGLRGREEGGMNRTPGH